MNLATMTEQIRRDLALRVLRRLKKRLDALLEANEQSAAMMSEKHWTQETKWIAEGERKGFKWATFEVQQEIERL